MQYSSDHENFMEHIEPDPGLHHIEDIIKNELVPSGIKLQSLHSLSYAKVDQSRGKNWMTSIKNMIDNREYCERPVDENPACRICSKAMETLIPALEKHKDDLSDITILKEKGMAYIFSKINEPEGNSFRLLVSVPSIEKK